ncbi:MAG TPA: hypothetical protein EYH35_03370 [Thiotrichaceae bacterium]|nr:hypothetical protein [Thiotrichaceae bacterium]
MKIDAKIFAVVIMFIGGLLYFFYAVYFLNKVSIYAENGDIENIQVIILTLSCITLMTPIFSQEREDKLILVFFSLLSFSFILREVDVEDLDLVNSLKFLGHGIGRNVMLTTGFAVIGVYIVLDFNRYNILAKNFIMSLSGKVMITAGVALCVGGYFEHYHVLLHHVFFEEIFELLGYVLILIAALTMSKNECKIDTASVKSTA